MRLSLVRPCIVLALAACGAQGVPPTNGPTLEPRSERHVRFYEGTMPRCPVRDLGHVAGRDFRDLRSVAFRLHANAVILDPRSSRSTGSFSGMAVAFTRADCQQ